MNNYYKIVWEKGIGCDVVQQNLPRSAKIVSYIWNIQETVTRDILLGCDDDTALSVARGIAEKGGLILAFTKYFFSGNNLQACELKI